MSTNLSMLYYIAKVLYVLWHLEITQHYKPSPFTYNPMCMRYRAQQKIYTIKMQLCIINVINVTLWGACNFLERLIRFTRREIRAFPLNPSIVFSASSTCSFIYTCTYGFTSIVPEEHCSLSQVPRLTILLHSLHYCFLTLPKHSTYS